MKHLKTGEVARLLGVTSRTIQEWDRKGILVAQRTPSNQRYYLNDQILEALNKKKYKRNGTDLDVVRGKKVLITGGTGSLGQRLVHRICDVAKKVVVFSRDELKQHQTKQIFQDKSNIRYMIGNVRDKNRLMYATKDIDICIHAAALKRIEVNSYNPFEAVRTNIIGTMNVLEVCMENKVSKVLMVSTDKACSPGTLYGGTKFVSEQAFINGNNYVPRDSVILTVIRYGNIYGSNGSIRHIFEKQAKENNELTITHPEMSRFFMSIDSSVDLVLFALNNAIGGEIFVPKMKSISIMKLAEMFFPNVPKKISGLRSYEKIHEELISETESRYVVDCGEKYYKIIPPNANTPGIGWDINYPESKTLPPFQYSSDTVEELTKEEIMAFENNLD